MDVSSKEALIEAPPDYTPVPRIPCLSPHLKRLLIIMVVVVIIVLVVLGFLLMGLHISEKHTETVLRMTIQGLDGEGSLQQLSMSGKERTGTFHIKAGINSSATVVYDYHHLLICYKSWQGRACYITKMDKENIQGLDTIAKVFQHLQLEQGEEMEEVGFPVPQANRSILGTTINILCSNVPIYWLTRKLPPTEDLSTVISEFIPSQLDHCPLFKSLSALHTERTSKWHRRSSKMEINIEEALIEDPLHYNALDSEMDLCPSCTDCCPSCPSCTNCCPGCKSCCSCWKRVFCCLPKLLCRLPKLPGCPLHIKRILIIVVVIVLIVVVVLGALLLGLHVTQEHTESVLQMTIEGLEGEESQLRLSMDWEEEVATFHIDAGTHDPGTVVYDYSNLLISYKSWQGRACYITKMDKENIQGLDTTAKAFHQHLQLKSLIPTPEQGEEEEEDKGFPMPLADRSILGTTINILCSDVPIYWA
nr:pulmonary surfactant-associated protein C [Chrysemys picta bellii]